MMDGVFSFVLLDMHDKSFFAAYDAVGINPLYMGLGLDDRLSFILYCKKHFKGMQCSHM